MGPRNNKYQKIWESIFPWIRPVFGDGSLAYCSYCKVNLNIGSKGRTTLNNHSETVKHKNRVSEFEDSSQRTFSSDGVLTAGSSNSLCKEDLVVRAEILEAFKCVESNRSFQSADGDNERYRIMFPDSEIAKCYQQGQTKMKYNIEFGIAPYVIDMIKKDFFEQPFTFKFDETTTSQVIKQYDGYICYFSKSANNIITRYCGSIFMGHCTAKDLVEHFYEFIRKLRLDLDFLMNIGMDGPNVNKKFEKDLIKDLEMKKSSSFLSIGSCNLHTVNNGFGKGINVLKEIVDLDQFAIDLNFFFKLSAARREDFEKVSSLTEITTQYMLKHCTTRWLSIKKVLLRIIEQYENLIEYFLTSLPKEKNFKREISGTPRYQRIEKLLKSKLTLPYMSYIVYLASDFESFMIPFQTDAPMVHVLHPKMLALLKSMLRKFIDSKYLKEDDSIANQIHNLLDMNLADKNLHLVLCDIGAKASSMVKKFDALEAKKFHQTAKNVLIRCSEYLQSKLPLDNQILVDVKLLNPINRTKKSGHKGIERLAKKVLDILGDAAVKKIFFSKYDRYSIIDMIKKEFLEYQTEILPKDFTKVEEIPKSG